jgi:hypothetical protein
VVNYLRLKKQQIQIQESFDRGLAVGLSRSQTEAIADGLGSHINYSGTTNVDLSEGSSYMAPTLFTSAGFQRVVARFYFDDEQRLLWWTVRLTSDP